MSHSQAPAWECISLGQRSDKILQWVDLDTKLLKTQNTKMRQLFKPISIHTALFILKI
jgi:hypothetical protein